MSEEGGRPTGVIRILATLAIAALVLGLVGLGLSRVTIDTSTSSFVPRGDGSLSALEARDDDFGGDPVVVVLHGTTPDGLLIDAGQLPQLVRLEGRLAKLADVAVVYGPGTVLNQTATSIRNVIAQISGRRDGIENTARAEAKQRKLGPKATEAFVAKALAAFDQRYGTLITEALPIGLPSLKNQKFVASVLFDNAGEPRPEWRFLAPTAKSATLLVRPRAGLDQQATARLVDAVRATVHDAQEAGLKTDRPIITGVPVLTSAVSHRASHETPRLGALALAGVGLVFLLIPWSRRWRDRLRPILVAALGTATTIGIFGLLDRPLSLGVVAFLPIVLGIGSDFPLYLSQPTERRRVLVAAGAATLAFATLAISDLPFVREFGLALALGILVTIAWAMVLRARLPHVEPVRVKVRSAARWQRPARVLAAAAVLAAGAGWAALAGLDIESSPQQLADGLPELADVDRAEQSLGFSGEVSIVLRADGQTQTTVMTPEALAWAERVDDVVISRHADDVRPLLTLGQVLQFLGQDPSADQVAAGASLVPPYLLGAVATGDQSASSSTFGVRLRDLADQADLVTELRAELPAPPAGYSAEVVGLPVVASSGLEAIDASRWLIGIAAMLVAVLVVGLGLRSWRLALRVAGVSLVASGLVYLALAVLSVDLSPLTLAVGALITVTSCEFTVMLDGARRERRPWLGRSVTVAATAATVGYLCLAFSDLAVLRDFGLVLAAGVAASFLTARLAGVALPSAEPDDVEPEVGTEDDAVADDDREGELVP